MSASPKPHPSPTLDEFLRMPDIEEAPGLEYIDGRIVEKAMPNRSHGRIARGFANRINAFAEPMELGVADEELRHTFAGRSILPDASFLLSERVDLKSDGTSEEFVPYPPDVHIEVISPDQSVPQTRAKLLHSTANGCAIGVMVHPEKKTIDVYRPGRPPERLPDDGAIDFAPVLPGLVIPVAEVFSWMVVRPNRPGAGPA